MTDSDQQSIHDEISGEKLLLAVRGGTRKVVVAQVFSQLVSLATLAILYRLMSLAGSEFRYRAARDSQ